MRLENESDLLQTQAPKAFSEPVSEDRLPIECHASGRMGQIQLMMFNSVVLPDPDGPSSAMTSPALTWRSMERKASTRVSPSP